MNESGLSASFKSFDCNISTKLATPNNGGWKNFLGKGHSTKTQGGGRVLYTFVIFRRALIGSPNK